MNGGEMTLCPLKWQKVDFNGFRTIELSIDSVVNCGTWIGVQQEQVTEGPKRSL